ncbi:hypothetical protein HYH03_000751 [Edaphochlamys debaryana]|uniref:Large ribosomal subunit protein bL9c n=1 Tax=Edaphochlamys debaryana TaxID=47281 RepID=A0A835YFQ8_9CHLO|nr:hypothetical protein HYH03_000751 [Edaphochlamys debaryana]|eukprot:KAG2500924.1 hypothetical protein HYH03_000751 [Edaphochlamys debaryana]
MSTMLRGAPVSGAVFKPAKGIRAPVSRTALLVEANKKVAKKAKIILVNDIPNVGREGEIKSVPVGYWRNFLLPNGMAKIANESILNEIRRKKEDEIRKKMEEKAQAQAFASALSTIGKFLIKKKSGEKDQIYGSVQVQEIADAIYQQTGRNVSDCEIMVPEIKSVGTYECTIRLHPEVVGTFSVVVQKEKQTLTVKTTEGKKKGK